MIGVNFINLILLPVFMTIPAVILYFIIKCFIIKIAIKNAVK